MKSHREWTPETTFCINLNHRVDKLDRFTREMRRLGKGFTRFPAVDGRDVPPGNQWLTRGQTGCIMSHMSIWHHAYVRGFSEIVVFEDDCVPSTNFLNELDDFMSEDSPERWIIRLGISGVGCETWAGHEFKQVTARARVLTAPLWCAHAYILKRPAIDVLNHSMQYWYTAPELMMEADYYLYGMTPPKETRERGIKLPVHSIPNYVPNENLCVQSGTRVSDISGNVVEESRDPRFQHDLPGYPA